MPAPVLYYIRHGLTDWNAEQRFQGRQDIAINQIGREQAARNGEKLKQLVANPGEFDFVASPLKRACQTMEVIRRTMGLDPKIYETEPLLVEMSYGELEGVTLDTIEQDRPEVFADRLKDRWNFQPPNGESLQMTMERIIPYFDRIERNTIVVGHGSAGRALRKYLLNINDHDAAWFDFPQDRVFRYANGIETQY